MGDITKRRWNRMMIEAGEAMPVLIAIVFLVVLVAVMVNKLQQNDGCVVNCTIQAEQICEQDCLKADYRRALLDTFQPDATGKPHELETIDYKHKVKVVTWVSAQTAEKLKDPGTPEVPGPSTKWELWVTKAPRIQKFCRDYVGTHGKDEKQLDLRLKQRLGLPPDGHYDMFVELEITPQDKTQLFRPCGTPSSLSTEVPFTSCVPAAPQEQWRATNLKTKLSDPKTRGQEINSSDQEALDEYWFVDKYYQSFATSKPYPWTGLGYTFDWARKKDGSGDFMWYGETEFVKAAGAPATFVHTYTTLDYCKP